MADEIITGGRTFNFLPYNATNNPYGLGGDGHNTIAPGETLSNFFLLFDSLRQDVLSTSNTSLSSNTIGTGSKTFTVVSNYNYLTNSDVKIVDAANPLNVMYGSVTSFNSSTLALVVNSIIATGSGTISSWKIIPSGAIGSTGATGAAYDISASTATTSLVDGYTIPISIGAGEANNRKITQANFFGTITETVNLQDNLLVRPELKDYSETMASVTAAATTTINIEDGNVIALAHGTNITTFTWSNPSATGKACSFTLVRTKDASGTTRTIAWPAAVKWAGGIAPTLTQTTGCVDIFTFMTLDAGATWHGFAASADSR